MMFEPSDSSRESIAEYHFVTLQTFRSEDEGFEFYNNYAREKGFSVRKSIVKRKDGTNEIYRRRFLCSKEGYRADKHFDKLDIKFSANGKIWYVTGFEDVHNHEFARSEHVPVLWSHRGLNDAQKAEAIALSLGGLRPFQIMDAMQKSHGGHGDIGFLMQDLYNFIAREKKKNVEGRDAEYVMNFMAYRREEDPDFYFEHTTDDEGRLQNLFWSDSQSQLDFSVFGDVVVFDSTYRVNKYNLPFVPFIGVGHHRNTIVFGCGILSDETVASYIWLLEAFLKAMRQRHPRSLITDGDAAMAKAIEAVMPSADHRLCSWHIEQNVIKRFKGKKLRGFRKFIYDPMEVDEFERKWVKYRERHNITDRDLWIWKMYELRNKWSAAYTNGRHFLGMQSNQRSESLNSRLHNCLERTMSLIDLVEHYEFCLLSMRKREVELDAVSYNFVRFTDRGADPFEKSAARIFTPTMFPKVKEQVRRLSKWEITEVTLDGGCMRYEVTSKENDDRRLHVKCTFKSTLLVNATCQCRMMESEDILCGHIFCVLRFLDLDTIPPCCISNRWKKDAKKAFPTELDTNMQIWSEQMERFHILRNKGHSALFKASKSVAETERVMRFFDNIMHQHDNNHDSAGATSFGPVPAHFSSARRHSTTGILNPNKKISKGAPSNKTRWKAKSELWRTN